jgi:hypothetical protein
MNGQRFIIVGMRQMAACLVLAVALTGCGGDSQAEREALQDRIDELEATTIAPTTAPPTTTTAPTTTTLPPGPVWDFDESYDYNAQNLVGAPIDPLFETDLSRILVGLTNAGGSLNERYWASYITVADLTCKSLNYLYDLGVEENWSKREAADFLEYWLDEAILTAREQPGFASMSDDEAITLISAAVIANDCKDVYDFFVDFIE